ncbi:hypothetical protein [Bacteroides sp. Phil13]|uniref:ABC transporter permease n=1 Tax=Bacteroides sp. Phil13 TaxID=1929999 RepID=UPI000ACC2A8A|nr:hypothetical protein [Bacteroides sp. Phil13]
MATFFTPDNLVTILEQGFIFAIMALGVYITYKILDFPDLSVDGTFPLGGAVTAILITKGVNAWLTLPIAFLIGALAGFITGVIHVKLKVRDLLSGIIMMTALYSINLHIAGKANLPIYGKGSIFTGQLVDCAPEAIKPYMTLIILAVIMIVIKLLMDAFMKTKTGYLLRAAGDNPMLVTSLAKDKGSVKILGLSLANGLVALAGSILCQEQQFFEVSSGTGTVVIGLASVIIGINLFKHFGWVKATTAVIVGAVLYKACYMFAICMKLSANDLKLITAVLFLVILVLSQERKRKVNKDARVKES